MQDELGEQQKKDLIFFLSYFRTTQGQKKGFDHIW